MGELIEEITHDLIEARRLVADLEAIFDQLKIQDHRFVTSWRLYLARTGDEARIGKYRLHHLRRTWSEHFGEEGRVGADVGLIAGAD